MKTDHDDQASQLLMKQAMLGLRSYQGNLTCAVHAIENGWLPEGDAPEVVAHLETLRRFIAAEGKLTADPFLLRFGLTVPGSQRGILPPLLVLHPNRGGFSTRRQREAFDQIDRLHEALTLARRFLPKLSLDTQAAVLELAQIARGNSISNDAEWLESYARLSEDDAESLAVQAIECLDSDQQSILEVGREALTCLASFRTPPLSDEALHALIDREYFWPACLYRESSESVARRIAEAIDGDHDSLSLNHRLLALAWTRSATAELLFRVWVNEPLPSFAQLHVPAEEYLPSAGWVLDGDGRAKDLISKECYRLSSAEGENSRAIIARDPVDELCPSCNSQLTSLFKFSKSELDLVQIGLPEAPRSVVSCLYCAMYGPVYSRYLADESCEFLCATGSCERLGEPPSPSGRRSLEVAACPRFACAEPFILEDASTVGGVPMWLQDAEYPRCIECNDYMAFLAQHDNGPVGEEGIHYAFYCAPCRVSAVTYQQT